MSKLNPPRTAKVATTTGDIAGGTGVVPVYSNEQTLRRLVMANLLWEDTFYVDGMKIADQIEQTVEALVVENKVSTVIDVAIQAREQFLLRHTPLLLLDLLVRNDEVRSNYSANIIEAYTRVVTRADMICDVINLHCSRRGVAATKIPKILKKALGICFTNFNEYQFGKHAGKAKSLSMSDAIRVVHPTPLNDEMSNLFAQVRQSAVPLPETWEVLISAAKQEERKSIWEKLIKEKKLGNLATLRNLNNMMKENVATTLIKQAIDGINGNKLFPFNVTNALSNSGSAFSYELGQLFRRSALSKPKLTGKSLIILDVSGSMNSHLSAKSKVTRQEAANALAFEATLRSEEAVVIVTAGSDGARTHKSELIKHPSGSLSDFLNEIAEKSRVVGGGGIFTRQVIDWAKSNADVQSFAPDRIIVISDSQDIDQHYGDTRTAQPWTRFSYVADISANKNGIVLNGKWTCEISGFSSATLDYIAAAELQQP